MMFINKKKSNTQRYIESSIRDTWFKIYKFFIKNNIKPVLIGGVAVNFHGYNRMTEDFDILVSKEDKEKMKDLPIGYIRDVSNKRCRAFIFSDGKEKIDVIYEGDIISNTIYPDPTILKNNVGVINLRDLIIIKLRTGRYRDVADVISLIRANKLSKDYYKNLPSDLKQHYLTCFEEYEKENNNWQK